jgi:hypothetical protein
VRLEGAGEKAFAERASDSDMRDAVLKGFRVANMGINKGGQELGGWCGEEAVFHEGDAVDT